MSQPSGREGFVPQAQREQYGAQPDHGYAPDEAERNDVIGSEDQAAHKQDGGIPPANPTKPSDQ